MKKALHHNGVGLFYIYNDCTQKAVSVTVHSPAQINECYLRSAICEAIADTINMKGLSESPPCISSP